MPKKSKNSKLVGASAEEAHWSDLLDVVDRALTTTMRRGFETIDLSNEDERLSMLRTIYSFTTMLLAQEAHASGIVDPLDELQAQAGVLRDDYPGLQSAPASKSANARRRKR